MKTLNVELADRSYPIHIGSGLLRQPDLLHPHIHGRQILVVSNEIVAPLYLPILLAGLTDYQTETLVLPDGEAQKNLGNLEQITGYLLEHRFSRNCTLIALGGGVIGDLVGFTAACYQRGVDFIQIPTTLLAQVDSSVGGKTAVNHRLGKNMVGAFHQPRVVLADTDVLTTLPERELAAGLAEVIKYGLIRDPDFLQWLEQNMTALCARDNAALTFAIERSCQNKADVVAADEREANQRALLNLGHTFGHAIETTLQYRDWLHGEAVATGMLMAADLSARLGWLATADVDRIKTLLLAAGLPVVPPMQASVATMQQHMQVDKKARDGVVFLVLLEALGKAVLTDKYPPAALTATLEHFCGSA
ncbi:MAG: 3-dehydroquinate synthase [Gammaproteobacteria bacterium]